MIPLELIPLLLLIVAFLSSSVGHGGASSYLALMALAGVVPSMIRPTALILNLFVAGIAFASFYKAGHFKWRLVWPFAITSVPVAYFGASISINLLIYKIILGICLLLTVARMLYKPKNANETIRELSIPIATISGVLFGFISGIIGIGGGVFLSPLLIAMRWAGVKEASAASAGFILLNSLSGLIALHGKDFVPENNIAIWVATALLGGILGSATGSYKLSETGFRYVLSGVLCFAAFKPII